MASDPGAQEREQRRLERAARRAGAPEPAADDAGHPHAEPAGGLFSSPAGRVLAALTGGLLLATLVALVVMWPTGHRHVLHGALGGATVRAEVTRQLDVSCQGPVAQRCRRVVARISEGADKGRHVTLDVGPVAVTPNLAPGTAIRVQRAEGAPPGSPYGYVDVDRRAPLVWIAVAFALLGVLVAGRKGLLALVGIVASAALVTVFLVPAILDGRPPVLTSLVAALAVMFITLLLTYGVTAPSLAAASGIATCLLFAVLAGDLALHLTHLDGRGGELAPYLQQAGVSGLSLQGIILAGMVIAALGVLTDTAVTQASAVMALRRTDPALRIRGLYREAFAVGRDHLAATMHTLVLVYVGTLLPLILLIESANIGVTDALNGQLVAEPLVATLIGAMALIISIPLTTLLAALLAVRVPRAALADVHAHAH